MESHRVAARLEALQRRIEELEQVRGEAYQFAGEVGAPVRVLENLAAAANGQPLPHESFLPIVAEECEEIADLHARLTRVRDALGAA